MSLALAIYGETAPSLRACDVPGCGSPVRETLRYRFQVHGGPDQVGTVYACAEHARQARADGRVVESLSAPVPASASELVHDRPAPRRSSGAVVLPRDETFAERRARIAAMPGPPIEVQPSRRDRLRHERESRERADACTDPERPVRRGEKADSEAVPIADGLDAGADRHWRYEAEAALCYLVGTLGSEAPAELKAAYALLGELPRTWPPTEAELLAARASDPAHRVTA